MSVELAAVVAELRARGTDLRTIEVKAAAGGLPKSVRETLSAFSNDDGGVLLLGLDEKAGFTPAAGFDATKIRDDLAALCADTMQPPVRADIDIEELDGALVVVADVPELAVAYKPCFVKAKGEFAGSYTRGGDGDRRLTEYEIALLHANRGQPREDLQPVSEATPSDLDPDAVARLLRRVRQREAAAFAGVSDEVALRRLGVLVEDAGGTLVPSVAGLLALGSYPQQFFPQLNVTFVSIPARSKDTIPADGPRFLDNRSLTGGIPLMVQDAVATVLRNSRIGGQVSEVGREDVYDYPVDALREVVANALMHRDYSPHARGTQVQVEMYLDRLEVRSPGGLFGTVTEETLGVEGISSSRNTHLARLLQDVVLPGTDQVVCENRGTGIPVMLRALRRAGLTVPRFRNSLTSFVVELPKHTLLDAEAHAWLAGLQQPDLTDVQRMALALMREGRTVTNATMRQLGLDRVEATNSLSDLVTRGLAVRVGGRRYAEYVLAETSPSVSPPAAAAVPVRRRRDRTEEIDRLFDDGGVWTIHDVVRSSGLGEGMARRYLRALVSAGRIEPTAPLTNTKRAYRRHNPATLTTNPDSR